MDIKGGRIEKCATGPGTTHDLKFEKQKAQLLEDLKSAVRVQFVNDAGDLIAADGLPYELTPPQGPVRMGQKVSASGILEWRVPKGESRLKLRFDQVPADLRRTANTVKSRKPPVEEGANVIGPIPWKDLVRRPISGIKTGVLNIVSIKQEVIPIIFVPGIMGSRLRRRNRGDESELHLPWALPPNYRGGKRAWDPDGIRWMLRFGLKDSAGRKALIVGENFNPRWLVPDYDNDGTLPLDRFPEAAARGWGGVMWGSYGDILQALEGQTWQLPAGVLFRQPVYAYPFNWSDSIRNTGDLLGRYIDEVVKRYAGAGENCKQVILVTHSMGGLVARWAAKQAETKVLGVLHGVQPARGAASGYWRMKAGFEPGGISPWILGRNGKQICAVMGSIPGGLQLLPSPHYTDNDGNPGWLVLRGRDRVRRLPSAPEKVYEEIYLADNYAQPWRLITEKFDLAPQRLNRPTDQVGIEDKAWADFTDVIGGEVIPFHKELDVYQHPETHAFYGIGTDTDHPTADKVEFKIVDLQKQPLGAMIAEADAGVSSFHAFPESYMRRGKFVSIYKDDDGRMYEAALLSPSGGGDGTVPESSGGALEVRGESHASPGLQCASERDGKAKGRYGAYGELNHQPAFKVNVGHGEESRDSHNTIEFTVRGIEMLCQLNVKRYRT